MPDNDPELGSIDVTLARPEDAVRIAEVLRESFAEFRPMYTHKGFESTTPDTWTIAERFEEGPTWVVLLENEIVGTISAVPEGNRSLYIRSMAVIPSARGRGLARLLLTAVEEHARQEGLRHLTLSTTPFLTRAIEIYGNSGFRRTKKGPHDLSGTPLFTMEKDL